MPLSMSAMMTAWTLVAPVVARHSSPVSRSDAVMMMNVGLPVSKSDVATYRSVISMGPVVAPGLFGIISWILRILACANASSTDVAETVCHAIVVERKSGAGSAYGVF